MINKEHLIQYQASKKNANRLYTGCIHGPLNELIEKVLSCFYLSYQEQKDAGQELRLVFLKEIITRDFSLIDRPDHWLFRAFVNHLKSQIRASKRKQSFNKWMNELISSNEYRYQS